MSNQYRVTTKHSPDCGEVGQVVDREYAYNHAAGYETFHLTLRFRDGSQGRYVIDDVEAA